MKGKTGGFTGKPPLLVELTEKEATELRDVLDQDVDLAGSPAAEELYNLLVKYADGSLT